MEKLQKALETFMGFVYIAWIVFLVDLIGCKLGGGHPLLYRFLGIKRKK